MLLLQFLILFFLLLFFMLLLVLYWVTNYELTARISQSLDLALVLGSSITVVQVLAVFDGMEVQ